MSIVALALTLSAPQSAVREAPPRPYGQETIIRFAGNGGLRDWTPGPPRSGIVFVRDRRERWYRVALSGPCVTNRAMQSFTYKTDPSGTFDRFSTVRFGQNPWQSCGVTSIVTSPPPPDKGGSHHHRG